MPSNADQLRRDAIRIWQAGVDAVKPERLFADQVLVENGVLSATDVAVDLSRFNRIAVVGAGKAGRGMALGLENSLGPRLLKEKGVSGLVSVPADCVGPTQAIELVAGRPAGINEPRPEGAEAAARILDIVGSLTERDLCICLISGGGSALLPAPIEGITLAEKVAITRLLASSGATINQLNTVRSPLSRIKGGGLARACKAGTLLTLILSDVLGDPLDIIASGPTVPTASRPEEALQVLADLKPTDHEAVRPIVTCLKSLPDKSPIEPAAEVHNVILANNAAAVDAAGIEAERLGYNHAMDCATSSEGAAEDVGVRLAEMAIRMREQPGPNCLITGGEPTVVLADEAIRGVGGRNQQLVLAALQELGDCDGIALLSGGTDGEDGPTDAAGAMIDQAIAQQARDKQLDIADALQRNDAYTFFKACGGLLQTGPTHTNVCDLRVVTVAN